MNILFVLYGDFSSTSANPLVLYARELHLAGHSSAVAVPASLETVSQHPNPSFKPLLYRDVLAEPESAFPDGRPADVIHAWTPREVVRHFVTSYMAIRPTPLLMYLEDNESWISCRTLGFEKGTLNQQTDQNISDKLPEALAHPFRYDSFIGLADAVAVIQDKLKVEVPPWVHCETVMPGVDLEFFSPRPGKPLLRKQYGVAKNEKVIVYHGVLDEFRRPGMETLCRAVGSINQQGYRCRLLRTGPFALDFLEQLPPEIASAVSDLGLLPKHELPDLLALADVFVQPGKIDPFEDLRLPSKVPEFLAMGLPVLMPDVNISHLFRDGVDAVLLRTGSAEEIASKCIDLFSDPQKTGRIGRAGRLLAEKYFDVRTQARRLENVYKTTCNHFNPAIASEVWRVKDENMPVPYLLARKVRLLAELRSPKFGFETGEILQEHARYIEFMQQRVKGLEVAVAQRDSQIGNLNQAVAQRDSQIGNLNQAVAQRDGQIGNLNQAVAQRDSQIGNLNQAVAQRDSQIGNLNQAVAERDSQIGNLNQAVAQRDSQIGNLNQAVVEHDKVIRQILNSNSWRITRPLRAVKSFFTTQSDVVLLAIRRSGGIRAAISKAVSVFKREGWNGLKRRLGDHYSDRAFSDRNDYSEWIRRYDTLTDEALATMRAHAASYSHKPLISVVMPTYNSKPEWLIEAIESVRKQIYSHWELCIADDASSDKTIRPILERYVQKDPRIKVVYREQNGHISAASNSALGLATGEWVALLDHDDLLAEHALFWVVDAINRNPAARLIYSDEDKIDDAGKRFAPYFKCDWNVDLFYSHNLIAHLGVYRANLLREIGGFRQGFEGSQDYDLVLRCVERIAPKQIHHISRVLYHWRMHAESAAQSMAAKPYAVLAGERALNEHFQRQTVKAVSKSIGHGYRVRYALPDMLPLVSLIIPTRNGLRLLRRCVESILKKTTYHNYEILIVDNESDDPATLQYFKELQSESRIRVIRVDRPFNYSALNNEAVKLARGELVGLLNNDIEVISKDWLSEMVSHALRPGVGAVGARLWYPNNTLQHGGVILGIGGVGGHSHKHLARHQNGYFSRAHLIQSCCAVTAACLVIRKEIFEAVGGFNEKLQIAFNDIDFCLRVRESGYRNIWTPYAELYHHESATRGFEDTSDKEARFSKEAEYMKKHWDSLLLNDPAYSPNLTLDNEDFSLAWPPRVDLLPPTQVSKPVQRNELLSQ